MHDRGQDEQGDQAGEEDAHGRRGGERGQDALRGEGVEEVRDEAAELYEGAPDVEGGAGDGDVEEDGGLGGEADPEEGGEDPGGAQHGGDEAVLDGHCDGGVAGAALGEAAGDGVDGDGGEGGDEDGGEGGEEGEAPAGEGEVVGHVQDDGDGYEPCEEDAEVEGEDKSGADHDGLSDHHAEGLQDREVGGGEEGVAAGGGRKVVRHLGFTGAVADDLARVGLRGEGAEDESKGCEHEWHVLCIAPVLGGDDGAAYYGAEGGTEVGCHGERGVIGQGVQCRPNIGEGPLDVDHCGTAEETSEEAAGCEGGMALGLAGTDEEKAHDEGADKIYGIAANTLGDVRCVEGCEENAEEEEREAED